MERKSRSRSRSRTRKHSGSPSSPKGTRYTRRNRWASPPRAVSRRRRRSTSKLHQPGVCEQDMVEFVDRLQRFAVDNNVKAGIEQLEKCIHARIFDQYKLSVKYGVAANAGHTEMIRALEEFLPYYKSLLGLRPEVLRSVKVRFYERPRKAIRMMVEGSVVM